MIPETFAWPWVFCLLPLPFLFRRIFSSPVKQRDETALRVPFYDDYGRINSLSVFSIKMLPKGSYLLFLAWLLAVAALARPQTREAVVSLTQHGRDVMLGVDISGSMTRPDMTLDGREAQRLHVAKRAVREFVQARAGDKFGLVVFGTRAHLYVPPTFDGDSLVFLLDELETGMAGPATAMGDALALAVGTLKEREAKDKVVVLLTDGATNTGIHSPDEALEMAVAAGVKVHTIGFYGTAGSDLNPALLQQIAKGTGGQAFLATSQAELKEVYDIISALEPAPTEREAFFLKEMFPVPLALAGLAFVLALARSFMFKRTGR